MSSSYLPKRLGDPAVTGAAAACLILIAHLPSFMHRLLDGDEAIYGSIAVLMNMGGGLYDAGGVDNKPPGIFWVYALTFRLFGAYDMTAIHVVALVVLAATCVVIFFIARDAAGARAGVLAALFYGLLTAAGNPRLLAANTELFMMLPLAASVMCALRRRWFWCGVLLVVGFAFRQSAAGNVVFVAAAIWWLEASSTRMRGALMFVAGGLAGLAAGALLVATTGSLPGFWRWTIETLVGYAAGNWTPGVVFPRARDSLVLFVVDMAVLWIAAIAVVVRWRSLTVPLRLMAVWLMAGMAGSLAGGHLSWHYFIQAMGPLAVLAAVAFATIRLRRAVAAVVIAGIVVPAAGWWVFDVTADPLTYDFTAPVPRHEAVAAYIAAHTKHGDRVFVWGDWPALYVESDRTMAGRFPGFLRGFARGSGIPANNWDTAPDVWPLLQTDLAENPPALIVDTAPADWSDFAGYPMADYPVLASFVARDYHQVDVVDGVVIYARNAS